jgi:hypothetical protein
MNGLVLFLLVQSIAPDTVRLREVSTRVSLGQAPDSLRYGSPQVRLRTGQGTALVWLLRAADRVLIIASIPDSTPYWGDDFVVSLDTGGDGASTPQHDDFQFYFRRVLDSSVVFRGRNERWEPPRDDPDWRLGSDRSGGGWEIGADNGSRGWNLILRLDPAWRIAFRIYDDSPSGWFSWPTASGLTPATTVERTPSLWVPVR